MTSTLSMSPLLMPFTPTGKPSTTKIGDEPRREEAAPIDTIAAVATTGVGAVARLVEQAAIGTPPTRRSSTVRMIATLSMGPRSRNAIVGP
jgi:hypothetical protein